MLGRLAAGAALIALAACAGMEPAGRNATRADAPPPVERHAPVAPPPAYVPPPPSRAYVAPAPAPTPQPVPQTSAAPSVAVASIAAPPAPAPTSAADPNADVTVQAPARQLEAPHGDSRSVAERREDMQTWDHCILAVQQTYASDPTEPELDTPEEVCRRQLGQANRTAVPSSRLVRPR